MASREMSWKPTEQEAKTVLEKLDNDLIPMRMLFPDPEYFPRDSWEARLDAVIKTQDQWILLSNYAAGRRWSSMKAEDVQLFDFWLLDWFDYEGWIRGAQRPDHNDDEVQARRSKRSRNQKRKHPYSAQDLDKVFIGFISSSKTSVSLSDLNAFERMWMHVRSGQANIRSASAGGDRDNRVITMTKPTNWKLPEIPKDSKKESSGSYDADKEDAIFQIYCKYRAWGYDCPEEMIIGEPELAESAGI